MNLIKHPGSTKPSTDLPTIQSDAWGMDQEMGMSVSICWFVQIHVLFMY